MQTIAPRGGVAFGDFYAMRLCTLLAFAFCAPLLAGCHVRTHHTDGNDKNVDIGTPFGSVHVKSDHDASGADTGLPVYPGAVADSGDGNDGDSADVNVSFGSFHLSVKTASYLSTDSPAAITSFYRKQMAKYGDVVECNGTAPLGQPTRTAQGLTCDDQHRGYQVNIGEQGKTRLIAGSPQHQHLALFEPKGSSTHIALIALDLPYNHKNAEEE